MSTTNNRILNHFTGPTLWIASVQYFIIQLVVAMKWPKSHPYSWAHNTISDLGNTHCGLYGSRVVCSELHSTMNASFVVLGITMLLGAFLFKRYATSNIARTGFGCIGLAGIGTILVGLFPENTISTLHISGAALIFIAGNIGMIILGSWLTSISRFFRIYSIVSGVIGLIALGFFFTQTYLETGEGGMERITAYPLTVWLIFFGTYALLKKRPA